MAGSLHEIEFEWLHLQFKDIGTFTETYGFAGTQGNTNLEGMRIRPKGVPSRTLLVFMHPASTLQLLPVPRRLAALGMHVLCAGSRYAKNDSALVMEKVLLDLGAYIHHAKDVWGYEKVVLMGWSGGGSLSLFYQSQAEHPDITQTPAGDPVDLRAAGLIAADAVVCQAVHISRAQMLCDMIDPSVTNELDPDNRIARLDIYDRGNPSVPPYFDDFIAEYRAAQLHRLRKIAAWVKETLADLKQRATGEIERGFVVHRTMADPRFLDPALDPNGRRARWCYLGNPETVNTGPVGLARFSTLRSFLSQWSIDDSRADGLACAARISVPFLAIENAADDCVPQPHMRKITDAIASSDKSLQVIEGATHFYADQPGLLDDAARRVMHWLDQRRLLVS